MKKSFIILLLQLFCLHNVFAVEEGVVSDDFTVYYGGVCYKFSNFEVSKPLFAPRAIATPRGVIIQAPKEGKYSGEIEIPSSIVVNEGASFVRNAKIESMNYEGEVVYSIGAGRYDVMGCALDAFEDNPDLVGVTFPEQGLIQDYWYYNISFRNCKSLLYVNNLPLKTVQDYQFEGCKRLLYLDLSKTEIIGDYAFHDCYNLNRIDLRKVESIGDHAFDGCASLNTDGINERLIQLKWLTYIGDSAFSECTT